MNKWQKIKKGLGIVIIGTGFIGAAIILDMLIAKSIYHPFTYVYSGLGSLECFKSPETGGHCQTLNNSPAPILAKNGMVVTTQHLASDVGKEILQSGGNAIDAAVAVGYALAVTNPCCGNIGGGGFMVIHLANGKDTFINFREEAPLAATTDLYLNKKEDTKKYLAVAVPGTVKGLDTVLSKYGTLTRERVMTPAINLAEKGFVLNSNDARILSKGTKKFQQNPLAASIFLKDGKIPYKEGERLVQTNLAQTLKLISQQGADAFYKGTIAQEIVQTSQNNGGILTTTDLANYKIEETEPIICSYRTYDIVSAPAPGGGFTLCEMLNILDGYPLALTSWHDPKMIHLTLSAMLLAYTDRSSYLSDPNFANNSMQNLNSKEYIKMLRDKIPQEQAIYPIVKTELQEGEGTNTINYSIVDRYGNAVAASYTLNRNFGLGIIAGKTGFFLNDSNNAFTWKTLVPNANTIKASKRPLSSMTPTIVKKDGKLFLVTGSSGGPTITTISTVLQTLSNVIDYGMDINTAVNSPRIHYQGSDNLVFTEVNALSPPIVQRLWEIGYKVIPMFSWGEAESILVDPKTGMFSSPTNNRNSTGGTVGY